MSQIIWVDDSGNEIIWADDSGHAIEWSGLPPAEFKDYGFPPLSPTTLLNVIKSYLYVQYSDDYSLQSFVDAFNTLAQDYVSYMANLNLPVYASTSVTAGLLDWVGQGLYGITRPALPSSATTAKGPLNTLPLNIGPLNFYQKAAVTKYYLTDDDTYRRVMTWSLARSEGKAFNMRWLKARIERFLYGVNGLALAVDQTYRVSVSVNGRQVNIKILSNSRTYIKGTLNNGLLNTLPLNGFTSSNVVYPSIPEAPVLKAAIEGGVLPLPFQFTYVVNI